MAIREDGDIGFPDLADPASDRKGFVVEALRASDPGRANDSAVYLEGGPDVGVGDVAHI